MVVVLVAAAAAEVQWPTGGPTGPESMTFLFYENFFAERHLTSQTRVTRGRDLALKKELFAVKIVSRALCRELPLGKCAAKGKGALCREHLAHGNCEDSCSDVIAI
jgi:hypothetical protein